MSIKFYNTLTKVKDEFKPLEGDTVRIYTCGPTVYKDATIGNMKSYIYPNTYENYGFNYTYTLEIHIVGYLNIVIKFMSKE